MIFLSENNQFNSNKLLVFYGNIYKDMQVLKLKLRRDERTVFIQNKSYKYGYNILIIGIYIYILYKAIRFNEFSFGLIGLVGISGYAMIVYQYMQRIFAIKGNIALSIWVIFSAVIGTGAFIFIIPNLR